MASRSFRFVFRLAFVSMLGAWLSGCGLPPAIALMSSAADGISFIAAGKSFSDVALSAMTDQDCAVIRIINNDAICREATGDRRPAGVVVSAEMVAEFAAVDQTSESFYMLRHGEPVLSASAAELTTSRALLKGFAAGTELFALVQDDGTLEVFAHDPALAGDRSNMRLVVRIADYATQPGSFQTLRLNGANLVIADIIV